MEINPTRHCQPLFAKGFRRWEKSVCENRVKTAVRSGKNRGISKIFIEKWPHSEEFSQCKNMEGWNFNVFQAGRKKFVIAAAASCDCSTARRCAREGICRGLAGEGNDCPYINNDCTYIELLNNLSC